MRLIDADVLREVMYHEAFEKDTDMQKWDGGCWIRYKMFRNAIESAPTIDPVRHGYWKETDDPMFRACSVCGYLEWGGLWNNYCPECGAKMDGGTE